MASAEYDTENGRYDDEARYDRGRSASPRDEQRRDRSRSRSPGRGDNRDSRRGGDDDEGSVNPGSNLFVTGIHPRLTESDVSRLFEKYGDVENCSILLDPHTKESRGFGFVKMMTAEQADAAKEGLQGEVIEGRTLSIEKARRSRPRTPTPGKYFGPPKRESRKPPYGRDRFDDRRSGYGGGWRRSDDQRHGGRYDSYGDRNRSYGGRDSGRRDYRGDDYGSYRSADRYASYSRDERYSRDDRRGEDRRGFYDRDANPSSYDAAAPRESRDAYAGRSHESRGGGDDRW